MAKAFSPRLGFVGVVFLLAVVFTYCGGGKASSPAQPSTSPPPAPAGPTGSFTITCGSDVLDLGWSGSDQRSCTITAVNGFNVDVTLACAGLSGVSCTFSSPTVRPTAAGVSFTVTVTYSDGSPFGVFEATITGTVAGATQTANARVTVQRDGDSVTRHCPSPSDVQTIDAALTLIFDHDPTTGNIVCSAAQSARDLTYFRANVYKALSLMRHITFSSALPWTSGASLWDWLTSSIRGLRFRGDITQSSCCAGDRIPDISTVLAAAHPEQIIFTRLTDLMSAITIFTHESRHANGNSFPHDPRGCGDPNLEYTGGNGVSTYLSFWMANQAPSGFVSVQQRTGLFAVIRNTCTSRFCDATSRLALPGG
jgi:hypothetical protein